MKKNNIIKILGYVASIVGIGANLISEYVNDKKMDEKIEEKVNEALALKNDDEEES